MDPAACAAPPALPPGAKPLAALAETGPSPTSASAQADLEAGLARVKAPALIIGVQSDLLFPVTQQVGGRCRRRS